MFVRARARRRGTDGCTCESGVRVAVVAGANRGVREEKGASCARWGQTLRLARSGRAHRGPYHHRRPPPRRIVAAPRTDRARPVRTGRRTGQFAFFRRAPRIVVSAPSAFHRFIHTRGTVVSRKKTIDIIFFFWFCCVCFSLKRHYYHLQ